MPITNGFRLTKPRASVMILEGTAALVSAVLLVWLLGWFIQRKFIGEPVQAFFVQVDEISTDEVPFQAADIRALMGLSGVEQIHGISPFDLLENLKAIVSKRAGPVVAYVSAPVLVRGPEAMIGDTPIKTLIQTVARSANRDVLLALDLAQIDTDRERHLFGNSPYESLAEAIRTIGNPSPSVFILTSAAPAQKSWAYDELGRSVFAYYLQKGLEEDAESSGSRRDSRLTIEGLYRYMSGHVAAWARANRQAVQTPMLFAVGDRSPSDVVLRRIKPTKPPDSSPSTPPRGPGVDSKTKDEAKISEESGPANDKVKATEPTPNSGEPVLDELIKEWSEHDTLTNTQRHQRVPGAWQSYQAALLAAERMVRASWKDPDLTPQAQAGLNAAAVKRTLMLTALRHRAEDVDKIVPFRAISKDEAGKLALSQSLRFLTGADLPDLSPAPAPELAQPTPEARKEASKSDPGKPAASDPTEFLKLLAEIGPGGYPKNFLELQLPSWAYRFTQAFETTDYFKQKDDARGAYLRQLVRVRADAERALGIDARGLPIIKNIIKKGDEQRRELQDRLFGGMVTADAPSLEWHEEITDVGKEYKRALDLIDVFLKARLTLEQAADELPYLAEWAIRNQAHQEDVLRSAGESPLPPIVDDALVEVEKLAQELEKSVKVPEDGPQLRDLETQTGKTEGALGLLRAQLDKQVSDLQSGNARWTALDAALHVPRIPPASRRVLLEKIRRISGSALGLGPADAQPASPEGEYPSDPGFWLRAAGLARLDVVLHQIGLEPGGDRKKLPTWELVDEAWSRPRSNRLETTEALSLFKTMSTEIGTLAREAAKLSKHNSSNEPTRVRNQIAAALHKGDRIVRFLTAQEINQAGPTVDEPIERYERFARYATLAFHHERLCEDYTSSQPLVDLSRALESSEQMLGIQKDSARQRSSPSLQLRLNPKPPLKINEKTAKTSLEIQVQPTDDESERPPPIPKGEAFVGVVNPNPSALSIPGKVAGPIAGELVDVHQSKHKHLFEIHQIKPEAAPSITLTTKVFYRGRVDQNSALSVEVEPHHFGSFVEVSIAQDRDDLMAKYNNKEDIVDSIMLNDQFKKHPGIGAMRLGKSLAFVLKLTNRAPFEQKLTCQWGFVNEKPAPKAKDLKLENQSGPFRLGPGATTDVLRQAVQSTDVTGGKRIHLAVNVVDSEGAPVLADPFVVTFRQVELSEYMTFDQTIDSREYNGVPQPCLVVFYKHEAKDLVTEPILVEDMQCTIKDALITKKSGIVLWPGDPAYEWFIPRGDRAEGAKWSGQVGAEPVKGEKFNP